MRSSKGTAQFLLMAFFILALLVYVTTKNANKKPPSQHPGEASYARQAAINSNNE